MVRCPVLPLPALPVCLAVVQLLGPCSAQFAVFGPPEPILAVEGEEVELPCHLSPEMSAENMELMWVRSSPRQVVHTFAHGQEDTPAAEFRGRTSILREDIAVGKAALWIQDVRASDRGNYLCYFQEGDSLAKAEVQLKVAALGSDPHFEMKGYKAGGIRLECTSAGWYTQPQIECRDARGQSLPAEVATEAADPQGLHAASASVILEGGTGEGVSCVIRNPCWARQGPFFRFWKLCVLAVFLTVIALEECRATAGNCLWRQQKTQALSKEKERERAEKEAAQAQEQQERSPNEKLQEELRWRKNQYRPREERSQTYAELKAALFQPAEVILDPDTAHPALLVSEDKRSLQRADTWQNLPENPERFCGNECVLGRESFSLGRHFWEVEVGDRAQWCVGVCREEVRRKGGDKMAPENGFWTLGLNPGNSFRALTDPQTTLTNVSPPERVGVFLDYELGEVSFYNAIDGSHLFTFPHTYFPGPLRPVFWILTFEPTPLTICPAQKPVRRSLVPDPSLKTSVALGLAGGNEDPQAGETSVLLTAQPGPKDLLTSKTIQPEITY